MGLFSSIFGGGGSAKRAAQAAASKAGEARDTLGAQQEQYGAYYDPYREAGQQAIGQQQGVLGDVSRRIGEMDPRIAGLREQQAGLQPQVSEIYGLSQQMDDPIAKLLSGDMNAYQQTPGAEFRFEQGRKALEGSAAAKGNLFSGQTGKALTEYGQDYGTQEYDNYLSRLRGQLGDVQTQLGGRQTALGAGQNQINAGINLLDQDYRQIAAQMGVSNEYQSLISQGASAADAAARLGMNTANVQAGLTKGIGETYAGGMIEKDRQMKAAGDYWLNQKDKASEGVAAFLGGGIPQGGGGGATNFAGQVNNPYASRPALQTNATYGQPQLGGMAPQYGGAQPGGQNALEAKRLQTQSGFSRGF